MVEKDLLTENGGFGHSMDRPLFVHSQSYTPISVHLVPNYHLAGDPLELPQGALFFENQ